MTFSDDEDDNLAHFLKSEFLSEVSDKEEENVKEPEAKRKRVEEAETTKEDTKQSSSSLSEPDNCGVSSGVIPRSVETGFFSKIPPELFHHILKLFSSEDSSLQ